MTNKNHQISNNNKNVVYVINNIPTQQRSKSKKKKIPINITPNSLPPEQGFRAPDNRFLNSSNLNTEIQRSQLDNLINPKLRGKASEIEQRMFNIQNSIQDENDTLRKMNNLYSRFDSTPRFENSINNIYGINEDDDKGTFGATQGSDSFISEGMDRDQYLSPSEMSSLSESLNPSIPSERISFHRIPVPDFPFSPNSSYPIFNYPNQEGNSNDNEDVFSDVSSNASASLIGLPLTKSVSSEDKSTISIPDEPFISTNIPMKTSKLEDVPQQRNFPLTEPNTPMIISDPRFNNTSMLKDTPAQRNFPIITYTPMSIDETPPNTNNAPHPEKRKKPEESMNTPNVNTPQPHKMNKANTPAITAMLSKLSNDLDTINFTPDNINNNVETTRGLYKGSSPVFDYPSPQIENVQTSMATPSPRKEVPKLSQEETRELLKNEYRTLGGTNPAIFNTTRKRTLDDEIKRLKQVRELQETYRFNGGEDPLLLNSNDVKVNVLKKAISNQVKEQQQQNAKLAKKRVVYI